MGCPPEIEFESSPGAFVSFCFVSFSKSAKVWLWALNRPNPALRPHWFYCFIVELISLEAQGCEVVFVAVCFEKGRSGRNKLLFFLESSLLMNDWFPSLFLSQREVVSRADSLVWPRSCFLVFFFF